MSKTKKFPKKNLFDTHLINNDVLHFSSSEFRPPLLTDYHHRSVGTKKWENILTRFWFLFCMSNPIWETTSFTQFIILLREYKCGEILAVSPKCYSQMVKNIIKNIYPLKRSFNVDVIGKEVQNAAC